MLQGLCPLFLRLHKTVLVAPIVTSKKKNMGNELAAHSWKLFAGLRTNTVPQGYKRGVAIAKKYARAKKKTTQFTGMNIRKR